MSFRFLPVAGVSLLVAAAVGGKTPPPPSAETIRVIAHDYAFTAPETAKPGATTFTLENRGTKVHEMFIGLLRPGMGAAAIAAAHQKNINFRDLSTAYLDGDVGVALFAWPGKASPARASLDLLGGRSYILLCQLRDSLSMPQHAALGMFRVLRVD